MKTAIRPVLAWCWLLSLAWLLLEADLGLAQGEAVAPPAASLPDPALGNVPPGAVASVDSAPVRPPSDLTVAPPPNADGLTLRLDWKPSPSDLAVGQTTNPQGNPVRGYVVFRSILPTGPFAVVTAELPPGARSYQDKVTTDPEKDPPEQAYHYRVAAKVDGVEPLGLLVGPSCSPIQSGTLTGDWFNLPRLGLLLLLLGFTGLMFHYTNAMRRGREFFIRRIPGIDAIEEAIGRSTEMGKPILYVPGIDELQDIQTIASMLILGRVAEIVANYESDMIVPCTYPMVREVADEVVRAGYYVAGRPDAYDPKNVRFISSEQFAFCAGTNGIILRQKPAANLFLGRFFAESLIFAETGFVNKSIQIAGTAEPTQLPFFVVSCDYTVLGEELFAVSAYLSKDPRLVSSLRASDMIKALVIVSVLLGTLLGSLGYPQIKQAWAPRDVVTEGEK